MQIKLTERGKIIAHWLLLLAILCAIAIAGACVIWLADVIRGVYDNPLVTEAPSIVCQFDTILQSDGSCMKQEK